MIESTNPRAARGIRAFLLLPLVFLLHVTEEWFGGFPAWATDHFGTTSRAFFVLSHIPLVLLATACGWWASRASRGNIGVFVGVAAQATMAANGVFHLLTTALFLEYSPGALTSVAVYVPYTAFLFRSVLSHGWLTGRRIAVACLVGTTVSTGIVASLFLEIGFP